MSNIETSNNISYIIPAGNYWIGDPCYVFTHNHAAWMELLENCDFFNTANHCKYDNIEVYASNTFYGDGLYTDRDKPELKFPVDSGLIGIVPVSTINVIQDEIITQFLKDVGVFVTFNKPTEIRFDNGQFTFGNIFIDTHDEDEYEQDNDEEYDEYLNEEYNN